MSERALQKKWKRNNSEKNIGIINTVFMPFFMLHAVWNGWFYLFWNCIRTVCINHDLVSLHANFWHKKKQRAYNDVFFFNRSAFWLLISFAKKQKKKQILKISNVIMWVNFNLWTNGRFYCWQLRANDCSLGRTITQSSLVIVLLSRKHYSKIPTIQWQLHTHTSCIHSSGRFAFTVNGPNIQ